MSDLTPEEIEDALGELENLKETVGEMRSEMFDVDDVQNISQDVTAEQLHHYVHEDCDTEACERIREAMGVSPGDDPEPDDDGADADGGADPDDDGADADGGADPDDAPTDDGGDNPSADADAGDDDGEAESSDSDGDDVETNVFGEPV